MKNTFIIVTFISSVLFATFSHGQNIFKDKTFGSNSAVLISDANGEISYQWQADKLLTPASVLKVLTAQVALDHWGTDHQFHTDFYLENQILWVKGYGDPFLISEELDRVVAALIKRLENRSIEAIAVDGSYFQDVTVAGRTKVNDPYNAPLSAVSANFNTVYIAKSDKRVRSAESQTPVTPTAINLSRNLKPGKHRVNVGNAQVGQQYFAELLAEKLRLKGIRIANKVIINQQLPISAEYIYRHKNSHTMNDLLRGTLEYSNNFIANQLFMLFGQQSDNEFVSLSFAQQVITQRLKQNYANSSHWQQFSIVEGAGLSRDNRLSAKQLLDVLHDFEPHKALLKSYKQGKVRAKTGTLKGVRTFAGYIDANTRSGIKTFYFIFLFNDAVPYRFRESLLDELITSLEK